MKRLLIALVLVGLAGVVVPARAGEQPCVPLPPVVEHERIQKLEIDGVPVVVLLPVGYRSGERRYPVLYLLHGSLAHAEEAWPNDSDVIAFTESQPVDDRAIVVMPGGDLLGFRIDWVNGRYAPETFMTERLIPFIDAEFRTTGDAGRAIAGLSGGGYGALHLAARHPELFVAAGSFSGTGDLIGVSGPAVGLLELATLGALETACHAQIDPFPVCNGEELCWRNHNAADLAPNLKAVETWAAIGNGVPCDVEDVEDLLDVSRPYYHGEPALRVTNDHMHERFVAAGLVHTYQAASSCGVHTWRYWNMHLRAFWDVMFGAFGRQVPASFDFRSADASFDAWGWSFTADPARAPEFLDVADASCEGLSLTGSGLTTVTTARCFTPGASVLVDGIAHTADAEGRLTFTVDLGPAHQHQQYTPAARALEAAGGYWTSTTVELEELG